jgi:hypothetical protein
MVLGTISGMLSFTAWLLLRIFPIKIVSNAYFIGKILAKKYDKDSSYSLRDVKAMATDICGHAVSKLPRYESSYA